MTRAAPCSARRTAALLALLVVSGAAALLHESAWFRMLVPILGAGALPSAVVAAGALVGIAVGSALGGRLVDWAPGGLGRGNLPGPAIAARTFAGAELIAAISGLFVPAVLRGRGTLPLAAELAAAVAVLAIAAVPWGMSIPAAVRALARDDDRIGRDFAAAYAWNTAGAVLGVVAGAAFAFETWGNRRTIGVASSLQFLVCIGAQIWARSAGRAAPEPADGRPVPEVAPRPAAYPATRCPPRALLLLAAALVGAAGVGLQVAWMRRLTPILGATFPVFAAVLAVHLVGIAAGTALLGPRRGGRPDRAVARLAAVTAAATLVTAALLGPVVALVEASWWDAYGNPGAMLALRIAVAAVLVLPAVLAGAALLPWLVQLDAADVTHAGRTSGALLAANTAGSAVGGLVVALWGVPALGTAGAVCMCGAATLFGAACVLAGRARAVLGAAAAVVGAVAVFAPPGAAAGHTTVGALYSRDAYRPDDTLTRLAKDGRVASVLVRDRDGRLEFWVEGSYEASTGPTDRLHLGLLGHLPLVLWEARADRAPHVALVGLGGGFTAQAAAAHGPASLTIYELEPEVVSASEEFRAAGGGVPAGARVVTADGRKAVADGTGPLDILSADPVHPALAGSAYLYSADWWRAAMTRLSPEGLLVQWLPLYQLHEDDLRLVLRTFVASVPEPYVFLAGPDAILVGSRTPLRLSAARLERALAAPAAEELRAHGLATPGRLLGLLAAGPDACRRLAGEGDVNTDDRLLLELRSGWHEAGEPAASQTFLTSLAADPRSLLDAPPDAAFETELTAAHAFRDAMAAWMRDDFLDAADRFRAIAAAEPANDLARRMRDEADVEDAFALLAAGRIEDAKTLARDVARRDGIEQFLALEAAQVLERAGAVDEALRIASGYLKFGGSPRARRLSGPR